MALSVHLHRHYDGHLSFQSFVMPDAKSGELEKTENDFVNVYTRVCSVLI